MTRPINDSWYADQKRNGSYAIKRLGQAASAGCIATVPYREGRQAMTEANAHLIAAAPELLSALIALLGRAKKTSAYSWPEIENANLAIAKADPASAAARADLEQAVSESLQRGPSHP